MGLFFRKQPKPRRYYHKPIYWDPEKEEREKRMQKAEADAQCEQDGTYQVKLQRGDFRRMISNSHLDERARSVRKANYGLIAALVILLILVYIVIVNGGFWSLYFE